MAKDKETHTVAVKNEGVTIQGVDSQEGVVRIRPGHYRNLTLTENQAKRIDRLPHMTLHDPEDMATAADGEPDTGDGLSKTGTDDVNQEVTAEAFAEAVGKLEAGDFMNDGRPKVDVVNSKLATKYTSLDAAKRDELWTAHKEAQAGTTPAGEQTGGGAPGQPWNG